MKEVFLYTDGACRGNPGPGGYGVILQYKKHSREFSGGFAHTTNNRMEIFAAIVGLEALKEPCLVQMYSDSQYLVNAFTKDWLGSWQANQWRKKDKTPVLNQDLWQRLLVAANPHQIVWHWVKGHSDNKMNNRCDELARTAAKGQDLPQDATGLPQ